MADDPLAPHTFVFAYRIATPWLVHVLPVDDEVSFAAIAWLCSGAAGATLFFLLEALAACALTLGAYAIHMHNGGTDNISETSQPPYPIG